MHDDWKVCAATGKLLGAWRVAVRINGGDVFTLIVPTDDEDREHGLYSEAPGKGGFCLAYGTFQEIEAFVERHADDPGMWFKASHPRD